MNEEFEISPTLAHARGKFNDLTDPQAADERWLQRRQTSANKEEKISKAEAKRARRKARNINNMARE